MWGLESQWTYVCRNVQTYMRLIGSPDFYVIEPDIVGEFVGSLTWTTVYVCFPQVDLVSAKDPDIWTSERLYGE